MSLWKQLLIALCFGTAIGIAVPLAANSLISVPEQTETPFDITEFEQQPVNYHFVINQ
jgi:hypothetical protein